MKRPADPRADLEVAAWTREHALEILTALVQTGSVALSRDFAEQLDLDLDGMAAAATAELERRAKERGQ